MFSSCEENIISEVGDVPAAMMNIYNASFFNTGNVSNILKSSHCIIQQKYGLQSVIWSFFSFRNIFPESVARLSKTFCTICPLKGRLRGPF